jgi:predicted RNase H-like nuclease (RuvC/YqgF family)
VNRVIIGIDPGATGGIIIGDSDVPEVLSMPETEHDIQTL